MGPIQSMTGRDEDIEALFDEEPAPKTTRKRAKKVAKKASKKKAAKKAARKPARRLSSANVVGRATGEARGIAGFNANAILREVFSKAKGATIEDGVAAIMDATRGKKRADGQKYTRDLAAGRVRKFLFGYRGKGLLDNLGEVKSGPRKGESLYRYTGEVVVSRGRAASSAKASKKSTKKKATKKKAKRKKS